jgi:tetratricopeptide (TPR) repeat protein
LLFQLTSQTACDRLKTKEEREFASPYTNLAGVHLVLGQLSEAARLYRRRIELHPDDALIARVGLGIIAWHQGDESEARKHLEAALALWETVWLRRDQSPAGLLENKALALLGLGQTEAAITTLKEALAQRLPSDVIEFAPYDLLAAAPEPPPGLAEMRRLLEESVNG